MKNVRLKFSKGNDVKYISHLDLMRTFMRAVSRADIPIAYSGGFNPHPEMSFGAPLSVGVVSMAEFVDIYLKQEIPPQEIADKLNQFLPSGIRVLGAVGLPEKFKSAMALITHAKYSIKISTEQAVDGLEDKARSFVNQEAIIAKKAQPKKNFQIKEIDIRPMIVEFNLQESKEQYHIFNCLLLSGSKANLKPEILMEAFAEYAGLKVTRTNITRENVYVEHDGKLIDLLEFRD